MMMKNLLHFALEIERNQAYLKYYELTVIQKVWVTELFNTIQMIPQGKKISRALLVELYKQGFTYEELAEITDRLKASIYTSISTRLTAADKKQHSERKKFWTKLRNYVEFAYEADEVGTWDYFTINYPDTPLSAIKQRYRKCGGTLLFQTRQRKLKLDRLMVGRCIDRNLSPKAISEQLDMPISTVYLRIGDVLQSRYPDHPLEELKELYYKGELATLHSEADVGE